MSGAAPQNTDPPNEDDRLLSDHPSTTNEVVDSVHEIEPIAGPSHEDNREEFDNVPSVALPGKRRGTTVYYDGKGHLFHADKKKHGKRFLRCAKYEAGCRARATMNLADGSPIKPTLSSGPHNHGPNPQSLKLSEFRKVLSQRSRVETTLPLAMIYNDEVERNPESATLLPFSSVRRTMARKRRESVPTVPASIPEMVDAFSNPLVLQHYGQIFNGGFYRGPVYDNTGTLAALVFLNEDLIRVIGEHPSEVRELGMDGTFKVVPRSPSGFVQLFTVQVTFMDVAFPILFALMCSRTETAYVAVLAHFKEATEQWEIVLVMCDFEVALRRAIRVTYPGVRLLGCWFHFCQAIWRQVIHQGLAGECLHNPEMKMAVKMIMALPHLPPQPGLPHDSVTPETDITEGVRAIRTFIEESNILGLNSVIQYVERFWLRRVGAENFTTFCQPRRTNNDLEGFHCRLRSVMGMHPNVWKFLEMLLKLSRKYSTEVRSVSEGRRVRPSSRGNKNTLMVRKGVRKLITGEYTTVTFLRYMSHSVERLIDVLGQPHNINEDNREEENPDEPAPQPEFQDNQARRVEGNETLPVAEPEETENVQVPTEANVRVCKVCLLEPATHIVLPCGHLGVCHQCVNRLQTNNSTCPFCRAAVGNFVQFFDM